MIISLIKWRQLGGIAGGGGGRSIAVAIIIRTMRWRN